AWTDLRAFVEAGAEPAQLLERLRVDTEALDLLLRVGGFSRYAAEVARLRPHEFLALVAGREHRQVWGRGFLGATLADELAGADPAQRPTVLARFKHRHFLRIILGDVTGALGFEAVVRELSDIVDVLVQAALDLVAERHATLLATPATAFVVLGMGKHGARELNYSSDIDLIFLYRSGLEDDPEGAMHERFQRLGRDLISMLEDPDGRGRLFRVDMRLRPEGDKGELVLSLRETIDYYYSIGRPWERQAMIKARPIAGLRRDLGIGTAFVEELRPWVFPQEPEWETLEEARSMRRRIEERAQEANIKTGAGGIRDIEFLVQFFQLCFAGRLPELRARATLQMLRLVGDRGILPKRHADALEGYCIWLRTVEHRLQMWEDRQEHELPKAAPARRALALRCGFDGADPLARFDAHHAEVRLRVREIVARHFLTHTQEQDAMLALLVQGEADERLAGRYLAQGGFRDLPVAARNLRKLANESFFLLSRSRTERSLVAILPLLLRLFAKCPDPDQALDNFARIVSAVGGRATFFELLGARPEILQCFTDLAGWSTFLVALLQDFAGLADEIIDVLNQRPRNPALLANEARHLVHDLKDPGPPLAFLIARETAVVAIRDLQGLESARVGLHLSTLAQAVLSAVLQRLVTEQARQWGVPVQGGRPTRFAIIGLGKLGGGELTYASDTDVLFVCDPGGRCPRADHDGEEFWLRVAQGLMRTSADSRLYEIDPRLRPWGEHGPLVANMEELRNYWGAPRELWERMAMLRASYLAGDPRLADEALTLIRGAA
ncbi:MAG: hypothetical protein H0X38_17955, partial [Planctomycetes bacterium]|nr:hypothetical protein [Planctomycetota bacterium]